ncbi:methyl-accepting chemotaxis protein [Azovibrio restrictus]|uniref:methyl-accepting chemotaxis protein n=1 Tax=Azovibrio restrictus TaxID=146938 RepID=UPI0004260E1E|nr:methyl-accepting chemotaxis protein [Azovibrio restrictus]
MQQQGMTLKAKLTGLILVTVVALIMLFGMVLSMERSNLMRDREEKVRNLVEAAHAVIEHHARLVQEGKLDEAQAKTLALDTLRAMRYDKVEYFWVNDYQPRVLMHPIKPELQGKDMSATKDPNGKLLFVEFVNEVKKNGAGFVDYYWPKPGSEAPVAKISYVKGYAPWGWIVGSGIYLDDVDALFRKSALLLLGVGLGIGLLIAVPLALFARNLGRALGGEPDYAREITRRIAAGDLTTEVACRPGDTDSLLAGMRNMQQTLRAMITEVIQDAEQVSSAAGQLLTASEEVAERARQQSSAASSMAVSVEEMVTSMDQVTENAREASNLSREAGGISQQGAAIIHNAASEMRQISESVQASSRIIEELGQQSDQISSIVNTIKEIADQTNLLALNAAIEAARAGEQGRGFAVVADEVRKLAERTSLSTTEITTMVNKIQGGTRNAVTSMEDGVTQVSKGVELATQAGDSINQIQSGSQRVTEVVNGITDAIREQGQTSTLIARNIEQIAQMSEESAHAVTNTAEAARHLQTLSRSLHQAVSKFKTG